MGHLGAQPMLPQRLGQPFVADRPVRPGDPRLGTEFSELDARTLCEGMISSNCKINRVAHDQQALNATDIAAHALEALQDSAIREVVILGRRGVADAAFSVGEFLALGHLDGIDVIIDGPLEAPVDDTDLWATLKLDIAREYAERTPTPGNKRIVFRFMTIPVETFHAINMKDGFILLSMYGTKRSVITLAKAVAVVVGVVSGGVDVCFTRVAA